MRALRPDLFLPLGSDLWLVDEFQPVAVVIDPASGVVRRVVSWPALPPPGPGEPDRRVRRDGSALWVQHATGGSLARVGLDGIEVLVPTDGLGLVVCGPGAAWCAPPAPDQELRDGQESAPTRALGPGRLLRVTSDRQLASMAAQWPVRTVYAVADRLLVEVDLEQFTRRHLGAGMYEVVRQTQWLALAWDAPLPAVLTVAEHGLAGVPAVDRIDDGGIGPFWWREPSEPWPPLDPDVEVGSSPATETGPRSRSRTDSPTSTSSPTLRTRPIVHHARPELAAGLAGR